MSMPAFDVIVCGSLHLDILLYAPALPLPDETVPGRRWEQRCGGKGGNQATMAARFGVRTAMIGRIGDDDFGGKLRRNLVNANVDASAVTIDPQVGSGMSAAIVQDDGEYGAVIVSASNLRIAPASVGLAWRSLGGARVLILQNEVPEPVNIAAAEAARSDNACVILNAAPARAMSNELLGWIDVLVVNRVEAAMLAQREVADCEGALAALPSLTAVSRSVIITLGGAGVVVQPKGGAPTWIAAKAVKVASTHGAGDCFVGAFAARLARGEPIATAVEFANEAAADFVSQSSAGFATVG